MLIFHLFLGFPVIPTTSNADIFRSGDLLGFVNESYLFGFEFLAALEDTFELSLDLPFLVPELPSFPNFVNRNLIFLGVLLFEGLDFFFNTQPIDIDFVLEAIEFSVPSLGYIFLFNNTVKGI